MAGQKFKGHLAEEAKKRQQEHGGTAPGRAKSLEANFPQVFERAPQARDRAAKLVGVSGRLIDMAENVINARTSKIVLISKKGAIRVAGCRSVSGKRGVARRLLGLIGMSLAKREERFHGKHGSYYPE